MGCTTWRARVSLPIFSIHMNKEIKLLGYSWYNRDGAKYIDKHKRALELAGYNMSITHLAIQVGDFVYHAFTNATPGNRKKSHWIKRKVSDRCYKQPAMELTLGRSKWGYEYAMGLTADIRTPIIGQYIWFYSFFLIDIKRDCVWVAKKLIKYLLPDVPKLRAETPYNLFKELNNHGY